MAGAPQISGYELLLLFPQVMMLGFKHFHSGALLAFFVGAAGTTQFSCL